MAPALLATAPALLATAAGAGAQEIDLGRPLAAYEEPFGLIGGIRELSNGSVLVADPLGGVLVRLDPGLGSAEKLGSEGQGPGEYRQPDGIWPIGGDASLLVDLGNARLTVVSADGTLGDGTPIVLPAGDQGMGGMLMAIPGGTDANGHVYFTAGPLGPGGVRDSIALYRLDPATGDYEEIAMLKAPPYTTRQSGGGNNQNIMVSPVPLGSADTWGVTTDGGVFIAREAGYTVEYLAADGSVHRGDPVEYRPVRIRAAEREEWADDRARNGGIAMSVEIRGGSRSVSMSRDTGRRSELDALQWPDDKPPFANARVRVDSNGNGWIRRHLAAGEPALYDVFSAAGEHVRSVRFPEGRTLLGFGDGTVYVASTDAFDQQFLEKYALP